MFFEVLPNFTRSMTCPSALRSVIVSPLLFRPSPLVPSVAGNASTPSPSTGSEPDDRPPYTITAPRLARKSPS